MPETHRQIAEEAANLAVRKTAEAQKAVEVSRSVQNELSDERIGRALSGALRDVFGEKENSGRFIDTSRIPLICQDIKGIHGSLDEINDTMKWITRLIVGAVITALLGLVIISKI